MSEIAKIRVPVILGPTAVGKSAVALRIAEEEGFEILSCDSRQVYRGMDIGTAKPTPREQGRVTHWLIDIREPSESYSAYGFAVDAAEVIRESARRGAKILICGGTGLYFRFLTEGTGPKVPTDIPFRERYLQKVHNEGPETIFKELEQVDPETAARLHPHDTQRVIRALQVFHKTGVALSVHRKRTRGPSDIEFHVFVLTLERNSLYERINKRVDCMIDAGLWEEFCTLRRHGFGPTDPGMQCLGYKELTEVERGSRSLTETIDIIKRNTRRFAKRQTTWFAHQTQGLRVDVAESGCYSRIKKTTREFMET
ncbi:MAG: tRNA (adenosine(37)-N6)-dimethylallyltransferase MiaA [Chitinivibrionales bacterium]|nr:tRNA (adenosine(37)-N6)-dimethylallyltransferase MiaA [Chitinivibrionales bacterium]MBD3356417.1 tRNA (adenosine(37)-N6)-dimethylallyltransferase MiaA [Chitinivibrionales bacterium]